MFETFLASIPKNRSQMVNELDLPKDLKVAPYFWTEPEESLLTSDSLVSTSLGDHDVKTRSTDSSLALSRAMTDSEIDYGMYRRLKTRSFSDPWVEMKAVLDSFPPEYLASVNSAWGTRSGDHFTGNEAFHVSIDTDTIRILIPKQGYVKMSYGTRKTKK